MSHVCDIEGLELKTLETTLYTCGECDTKFTSICTLHQHVRRHNKGGFYFFDDVIKVAFPKSGTVCTATQTDLVLTNFIQHLQVAQKLAHISGGNLNAEESDEKLLSYDANCDKKDTKASRGKLDLKSGKPAVSNRTNVTDRMAKTSNDTELPSRCSSKALDEKDDDADDDGVSRQSVESVHHEPQLNTERIQTVTVLDFKAPVKVSKYRKTRLKKNSPVFKTNSCTRLVNNKEQSEEILITGVAENSETRFSNQIESEGNKYLTDRKTYVTHDGNEDLNTLNEKEFFNGKISSVHFEIQRIRPRGVFSRGEKNEHNKVSVTDTWIPVSEWTLDTMDPGHQVNTDEIEVSKKSRLTMPVQSDTKELNTLNRKWEYNQKPSFVCNVCGKSFKYRRHFDGHMNKHLGVRPYMCQYCGKSYHKLMTLQAHQLHVHSDRNAWLTCKVCGVRKFRTAARLRVHEETHNSDYKNICRKCNKSYKSIKLLKDHDKYVHCKKKFPCKNCKLSFASEEEYEVHQKARHNEVNNCRFCGRVFSSLQSKARHEKIHLGVKPHKCHICHRRFLQKTPFWVHMEKHHDLTKDKLIQLFPEKHLDKNKPRLLKNVQSERQLGSYMGTVSVQTESNS